MGLHSICDPHFNEIESSSNIFCIPIYCMFTCKGSSFYQGLNELSINDIAEVVFGKAITSLICFEFASNIISLSKPKAIPPCGGAPKTKGKFLDTIYGRKRRSESVSRYCSRSIWMMVWYNCKVDWITIIDCCYFTLE